MALHLLKLCVGCESIADLEGWIAESMALWRRLGKPEEQVHTTRMVPKRIADLLDGGSLFWVIKGHVACRQRLLDIRPFTDDQGVSRCHLVLEPLVVPVLSRPCRPFQGWRYLEATSAPTDLGAADSTLSAMPEEMWRELRTLGLL
ncbi:MAG: DUF1489 family protein [Alsobacter sp.]